MEMEVKYGMIIKTAIFVFVLFITSIPFGAACGQVSRQYEALFFPALGLLILAIWVFGTMALVTMAAGLVAALVRPFWVIILAFALSALAMILAMLLAWKISIVPVILGLFYAVLAIAYARSVAGELNNRLDFSVHVIGEGQKTLLFALILAVSVSFALGYREDALRRGSIVPPVCKQAVMEMIIPRLQAQIESRSELRPEEKAAALEEAKQVIERFWANAETTLQPYAEFIPPGLALTLIFTLNTLLSFVSWIPLLVLSGIFPLLKLTRVTRVVVETREVKRLTLG
jgi:hypothetical protein